METTIRKLHFIGIGGAGTSALATSVEAPVAAAGSTAERTSAAGAGAAAALVVAAAIDAAGARRAGLTGLRGLIQPLKTSAKSR